MAPYHVRTYVQSQATVEFQSTDRSLHGSLRHVTRACSYKWQSGNLESDRNENVEMITKEREREGDILKSFVCLFVYRKGMALEFGDE